MADIVEELRAVVNVYLTRQEAVDAGELEIHRVRIVPVRRKARLA